MTTEFTTGQIRPIECVKEAWALVKDEYWMLFAMSVVGALIGGVTMYVLLGPMICGIFICYLKKLDGGNLRFDDLWLGFKYFGRSLLVTVLIVVPIVGYIITIFATIYGPFIMKAVGGNRVSDNEMLTTFGVAIAIDLIVAVGMVCIHSLLIFAYPLIVDRGLSGWESIKLSARSALKNASGIGGLIVVNFLLAIAGELACGVGLYLVIPVLTASNLVAYRKVFPPIPPHPFQPPVLDHVS